MAVIDIDAHHANGTQSIFYDRPDVMVASVHVDPGAGWFPHYLGFADEIGRGAGQGANLNLPSPRAPGIRGGWPRSGQLSRRCAEFDPGAVVLSLRVDAAADDPESPLRVTADGYRSAAQQVAALGVPVVTVQEVGYHLPTLGDGSWRQRWTASPAERSPPTDPTNAAWPARPDGRGEPVAVPVHGDDRFTQGHVRFTWEAPSTAGAALTLLPMVGRE